MVRAKATVTRMKPREHRASRRVGGILRLLLVGLLHRRENRDRHGRLAAGDPTDY